ncbi:hypothetical protein ABNX05_18270 [Lysinibacillus sp. M3]|uniref:DUF3221 domain-containing protein n=1 Tax=Lysinibacillus zambalensis TaxID=3160866 RepID=A0ABV1MVN1_9BACI
MSFFGNQGGSNGGNSGISVCPSTYAVLNITERDALVAVQNGAICLVQDASADLSVKEGFAVYQRLGELWLKISDESIMRIQNTESIEETDNKRFVTTEEKQMISETKLRVDGIETILDESVMIQESITEPSKKNVLWISN